MDMLLPVFQLLYFSVHFLYSLGQAVLDCFYELYHHSSKLIWWKKRFSPSSKQLLQDASQLKKLPRHLAFIFMSKQTNSYKHICHVISWSIGIGIPCISLYDIDGILKSKLPSLLDNLSNICSDVTFKVHVDGQAYVKECPSLSSFHIDSTGESPCTYTGVKKTLQNSTGAYYPKPSKLAKQPFVNGKYNQTIMLNILCIEDGKENIIKLASNLCENKIEIDMNNIHKGLITGDQVDPDLAIVLGRPTCTLNFLPWQIRLTEFLNIPSVSRLSYVEFKKLLQIYSKCEQRFGS